MSHVLRLIAAFAATLTLCACDMVISEKPVFESADMAGGPVLKSGIWADERCHLYAEPPRPPAAKCPQWWVVTPKEIRVVYDKSMAPDPASPLPQTPSQYVLVGGRPPVAQLGVQMPPGKNGETLLLYYFLAVDPTLLDDKGRIVEAGFWPVLCGPPAPTPKTAPPLQGSDQPKWNLPPATLRPFPGITPGDLGCTPDGKAAVLNAAQPSRIFVEPVIRAHWVGPEKP
ncbi:MAG: hypothetical protein ACHP7N_00585 [Caulobacterales bacterium]